MTERKVILKSNNQAGKKELLEIRDLCDTLADISPRKLYRAGKPLPVEEYQRLYPEGIHWGALQTEEDGQLSHPAPLDVWLEEDDARPVKERKLKSQDRTKIAQAIASAVVKVDEEKLEEIENVAGKGKNK